MKSCQLNLPVDRDSRWQQWLAVALIAIVFATLIYFAYPTIQRYNRLIDPPRDTSGGGPVN